MTQLRHWWLKIAVALHRSVSGARGRSYADASGNPKRLRLARRQTLECLQAFGNNMEGLFVDGIDRHLRRAKQTRIVKRADLQDNQWQTRSSRCEMGPAFAAKFARHGAFEIGTREFARFAVCDVANFAAIASALEFHGLKPPQAYFRQPVIGHSSLAVARFSGHTDLYALP